MKEDLPLQILDSEDMHVVIGSKAIVEPQGVGERFVSKFIGWSAKKYLILHLPSHLALLEHLYNEKKLIIRYISCDGKVCGFETKVQGLIFTPQKVLFVDFPEKIVAHGIRSRKRMNVFLGGEISFNNIKYHCYILNLSSTGCKLVIEIDNHDIVTPKNGDTLYLKFILPGVSPSDYFIECYIVRIFENKKRGFNQYGVKFANSKESTLTSINDYIAHSEKYMEESCSLDN
ncbi:flagellar brake domain-containing protein [Desulfolutivibrio sulfoxidireducens]|uniref:flagellar brake domain-containing protein n=1 Tax=Desulfolutivibrio sulfoxidireducens TaxID=2773299 RepID=UPI00159D8F52|nr:flagellar brake protein [Desulfolutivibrio sulfoxidireducens]QLA17597.1 hypothetical protein GD605_16685 [Desulfolutivibrio sulfoxidireducens]